MQASSIITLDMVGQGDVLRIGDRERFAGAIYYSTSTMYDWVDVVLSGGDGEEALEFSLLDGIDRWYVVHFVARLGPEDIGLRRGRRIPGSIGYRDEEYTLQSDGQATTRRIDRRDEELRSHFADYVSGSRHVGVQIYDVREAVYDGEAEVWYGQEIDIGSVELLPIDTDHQRRGLLTNTIYRPLPAEEHKHWWSRGHQRD
ncbi:MAG: hypothetical protein JOZ41_21240 [Chloroflexi bacterium]|nr:hypothetical protein [Chloroflexota bacterium]